jgi:hypothetical protein
MSEEEIQTSWKDELPEELRDTTLVKEAPDLATLAKQAVDFQRMMGSMIRIPGEDASDEVREEFRGKLTKVGMVPLDDFTSYVRPKEINEYRLENPPEDVASIGLTQAHVDRWKDEAFSDGLSQAQFQARALRNIDNMRAEFNERANQYQAQEMQLKDEWGMPGYEPNRQRALAAAARFGGDELVAALKSNPDPAALKAFAKIGKEFEEQGMGDLQQPLSLPETKEEAGIKLQEITSNKEHPFNLGPSGAGRPAYDAAAKEVMRLRRIMAGENVNAPDYMFASG